MQFRLVRGETRRAILNRFPYAVYFRVTDKDIVLTGRPWPTAAAAMAIAPVASPLERFLKLCARNQLFLPETTQRSVRKPQ